VRYGGTAGAAYGYARVMYSPPNGSPNTNGVIDHVVANANRAVGILVDSELTSGGTTIVTISNADNVIYGNTTDGYTSLNLGQTFIDGRPEHKTAALDGAMS
jgi:hypothetical protein